ncbi:MAG TPA: 6-carboxytetrahydropterin synthase [Bryobacteraceae bacterium]|jgi:6-pyruvoyltetrahydropterin/6-carboxytetrahydropterin synthase|nr:6-carboxytetrahydropterin synthase [Bryobacteraceae bacterium]
MMRVTRKYRFAASHRLHAPTLGDAENRALYGKCNNPYGHGHNYEIAVTVRGPVEARSGRVVDPALLDGLVRRQVIEPFDHRNLNTEVEAFCAVVPTSENLGREVVRRLKQNWPVVFPADGPQLERIAIAETSRNAFEVTADEIE